MVELFLYSPIRLYGVALNCLSTGTIYDGYSESNLGLYQATNVLEGGKLSHAR